MVAKRQKGTAAKKRIRRARVIEDLIVCEQIRREIGGKQTLMGVFGRDIVFPNWPDPVDGEKVGVSTQLAFYIRIRYTGVRDVTISLTGPSNVEVFKIDTQLAIPNVTDVDEKPMVNIIMGGEPLILPSVGIYSLQIEYDGRRDSRQFDVKVNPDLVSDST